MATNFIQPGKTMPYTAPSGGVTSGGGYLIGGLFVVATDAVAAGSEFQGHTEGVFTLAKTTSEGAWVEGQPIFWDVANSKTSLNPTFGLPIGTVAEAALTGDATGNVRLNGESLAGRMLTIRKRFSTAQVNAGATLLAALPGIKYRMVDAFAIAVGGAMTANTTADILGTVTTSRKLVAFAQATMTQSTLVRAGDTGAAILADGASFTANDANTAITVGNTGSAITTMSNLDVHFTYMLEG